MCACLFVLAHGAVVSAQTLISAKSSDQTALEVFRECDFCPEMIALPLGDFLLGSTLEEATKANEENFALGSPAGRAEAIAREQPQRRVTVDLPIAMGRTEVTRGQWQTCVDAGGCGLRQKDRPQGTWTRNSLDDRLRSRLPKGPHQWHEDSPIVMLTYYEMQEYIAWLNGLVGVTVYRLPTEPEWEYAARAGSKTSYVRGRFPTRDEANFFVYTRTFENGKYTFSYDPENNRMPIPVDQLDAANAWGLRHMAGNVSELTLSCWSATHRSFRTTSRYLAASFQPLGCRRVYKDGSFWTHVALIRPARRLSVPQGNTHHWLGFRVVRDMRVPLKGGD